MNWMTVAYVFCLYCLEFCMFLKIFQKLPDGIEGLLGDVEDLLSDTSGLTNFSGF